MKFFATNEIGRTVAINSYGSFIEQINDGFNWKIEHNLNDQEFLVFESVDEDVKEFFAAMKIIENHPKQAAIYYFLDNERCSVEEAALMADRVGLLEMSVVEYAKQYIKNIDAGVLDLEKVVDISAVADQLIDNEVIDTYNIGYIDYTILLKDNY